ncbi:winged helix-turn-helix domain-containing protein [Lentzea sp. NBC_00516]|uniref:AfsR/SARP family transcriptional regulator n=1 Tax=Lentzea sp. NBC_00516 TaxID=2903582 RepID=UPI002E81ED0A|nr:BTAD domain-containing putative transcriptional regulator [Lentzea sp. NBC_00516]WUD29171.1 winged helix-turn-helix domain-containing protein [Lentzea sp. NBC_00516]
MTPGFRFNVLGSLEVWRDGQLVPIRTAKLRALLAALLIDANQVVPISTLTARLWDEDAPDGARNTLQNYVLRLRRALGGGAAGLVVTHPAGYRINVADGSCDLHRFDALTAEARRLAESGDVSRASTSLRRATDLWRAQPFLDVPSEKVQRDVVPALIEKRLDAIESRIDMDIDLGRHGDVLAELRELTAVYSWRERFWSQRMLALYRAGRQGDALKCYRDVRAVLSTELGVSPGAELTDLFQRILAADPELLREVPRPATREEPRVAGNLAAETTAFIGRRKELAHLGRLLEAGRLVTLTGAGGVGKSRLALHLAAQRAGTFGGGVWVADLAEPGGVDRTLATELGVRAEPGRGDRAGVVEHLRGERALLVLDNCEFSVGEVSAVVTELLGALPDLRILVTSRQRLGRPGEHVVVVAPMSVPPRSGDCRSPAGHDSVELLLSRTSAAAPEFRITHVDRRDVQTLCERLDGLPLAIELAAMRLGVLSLRDAVERSGDLFALLDSRGASHSLRGSVERSWELCSEPERRLWVRLAVIPGEFGLREAESACAGHGVAGGELVELVAGLVCKSILVADTSGPRTRYRMLGMLQEYGRLRSVDLAATEHGSQVPRLRSVAVSAR